MQPRIEQTTDNAESTQMSLLPDLGGAGDGNAEPPPTMAERFEAFHAGNPHIYDILVRLARQWIRQTGRRRLGIAALWERMRWELSVSTTDETPKLNNDHKAFYARLIMAQEPDLADLFETRRAAADDALDLGNAA